MLKNLLWTEDSIANINLPPENFLQLAGKLEEYVCTLSRVGRKEVDSLSPESAHIIARLHPIIIWSKKKYCICGIRTFHLISKHIPANEKIPVGVLPAKTSEEELRQLMHADTLLGMLSFSVKEPATIFQYSRQIPPELRTKLSPALADTVDTCAKLLGVSPPTLYKSKKNS